MRPVLASVMLAVSLAAPAEAARIGLKPLGRFAQPVYVASPPGVSRTVYVVERYGLIRAVRNGRVSRRPLADLRSRVYVEDPRENVDQRGLFSLAFAPDYRRSGLFYVDYVDRTGRLRVDELRRGRRSIRRVLDLGPASTQHHGGQLQFGRDGLLYVSTGMNDDPETSQDPSRPGGKILRLDPRQSNAQPEIYASGLRNPWRFSFDRGSGTMLIGDVGDTKAEEIDALAARAAPGANFGWPTFEGNVRRRQGGPTAVRSPALTYTHAAGRCAVTGGYVVRDPALRDYKGRYLYGDLCTGRIRSARLRGTALIDDRLEPFKVNYLVSFGEDARGRVYAVSFGGRVFRLRLIRR